MYEQNAKRTNWQRQNLAYIQKAERQNKKQKTKQKPNKNKNRTIPEEDLKTKNQKRTTKIS